MKTMNDPAKDAYFEPARYASKLAALISEHQSKDERPDWWQQVIAQLHSQLDKQFPQFEVEFDELTATDVIPPLKGGSAPAEQPDFFRLQKMAPTRMNLLEWRQNGFEQRLGELEARAAWVPIASGNDNAELAESIVDSCFPADVIPPWSSANPSELEILKEVSYEQGWHDERLNSMAKRLAALEDWADIDFDWPNNKETANCIHELIAAGMTGVTADMHEQLERLEQRNAERLRTVYGAINAVAGSAKPEIDRLNKRIDELGDVLIKALQSIDALESKAPC